MSDIDDFKKYIESFLKYPVLPGQDAEIIALMMDGTINKNGAKELLKYIAEHNMEKYHEFMNMSKEEILELIDNRIAA